MSPPPSAVESVGIDREHDRPHPLQIALYRRASPTQKLATVARMNASAIALKEAQIKSAHPDMPPSERSKMVRRWWLTARD